MILFLAFDFTNFIGRFHPILVHLPIGFLLLAIFMEWYERIVKRKQLSFLISFAWLLSGIGGALAALCGWWLGETGLYLENDLFWHRWLGILIVLLSFGGWLLKKKPTEYSRVFHYVFNVLILGLILFQGHLGGNLTHGQDYLLQHAPSSIKNIFQKEDTLQRINLIGKDSILVYHDLIEPSFAKKCFACHNAEVKRGGLNMEHPDSLLAGGENGPVLVSGNTLESEIFKRITLSQKSTKFMPPVGESMTYSEIQLLDWWINNGADYAISLKDAKLDESVKSLLLRTYGIDTTPKPWYETVKIEPADSSKITDLSSMGFVIKRLGFTNNLLDVKFEGKDLSDEKLQSLSEISEHITWLSFAKSNISDRELKYVAQFKNLTRLQLERTDISDEGIEPLSVLEHLETINLYETSVSDKCLEYLTQIPSLKRVYLWRTNLDIEKTTLFNEEHPHLEIIF